MLWVAIDCSHFHSLQLHPLTSPNMLSNGRSQAWNKKLQMNFTGLKCLQTHLCGKRMKIWDIKNVITCVPSQSFMQAKVPTWMCLRVRFLGEWFGVKSDWDVLRVWDVQRRILGKTSQSASKQCTKKSSTVNICKKQATSSFSRNLSSHHNAKLNHNFTLVICH